MRTAFIAFLFLTATTTAPAFAEEMSTVNPTPAQLQAAQAVVAPTATETSPWNLKVGLSSFENLSSAKGTGLTIGGAYDFNSFISAGMDFANFKLKSDNGTAQDDMDILTLNSNITPIRYQYENIDFTVGIELGLAINKVTVGAGTDTNAYYGANFGTTWNRQIGVQFGMKSSKQFSSFTTLSAIGYF